MNFSSIEYFVAVAEELSFTKAANRLGVTQQTLSASIASIEKELNCKLLVRHVPLELTYAGEQFLRHALRMQQDERAMRQEFLDISQDRSGHLCVGIASTRSHMLMPRTIALFQKTHPRIEIEVLEDVNQAIVRDLKTGKIDLAVGLIPEGMSGYVVQKLYREQLTLFVADSLLERIYGDSAQAVLDEVASTQSLAPLEACPLLMTGLKDEDVIDRYVQQMCDQAGITPNVIVSSRNLEPIFELCVGGAGMTFAPETLALSTFAGKSLDGLRQIYFDDMRAYDISTAWRSAPHVWSAITEFAEALRASVREQYD